MSPQQLTAVFLRLYTAMPETPERPGPADFALAAKWAHEGLDYELVEAALFLASARRLSRSPDIPPLQPIRSLYYFTHVLDEVRREPLDPEYVEYLQYRIRQARDGHPGQLHLGQESNDLTELERELPTEEKPAR